MRFERARHGSAAMGCIIGVSTSMKPCHRNIGAAIAPVCCASKTLRALRIHHQIEVALAVAQFDVVSREIFPQGQQVLRKNVSSSA